MLLCSRMGGEEGLLDGRVRIAYFIRPVLLTECEVYALLKESAWPKHAISEDVLGSGWRRA